MRLRRKHNIAALAIRAEQTEQALAKIKADDAFIPSPHDMKALAFLRVKSKHLATQIDDLEPIL